MLKKKTIRDVDVKDQIVLVRTDYNVPLIDDGAGNVRVASDFRVRESLPTIQYLLENGAKKVALISHLGRPEGVDEKLSLAPVAEVLAGLLPGVAVGFVEGGTMAEVAETVKAAPVGSVTLLENLRFRPEEKANSAEFAKELVESTGATLFVQDGFAVVHRAHASTDAITTLLPSVAGLLLEKEITMLRGALEKPEHPLVVLIGGAKVADKQPLIDEFLPVADRIIVGGKIAADGYATDHPQIYVAEDFDENSEGEKLDIGPISTAKIVDMLHGAKTVVWNGVLGKVEDPAYATSSTIVAQTLGEDDGETSIICGGDTSGFVENLAAEHPDWTVSLVSTGGGAALELLTGRELPGVAGLEDK